MLSIVLKQLLSQLKISKTCVQIAIITDYDIMYYNYYHNPQPNHDQRIEPDYRYFKQNLEMVKADIDKVNLEHNEKVHQLNKTSQNEATKVKYINQNYLNLFISKLRFLKRIFQSQDSGYIRYRVHNMALIFLGIHSKSFLSGSNVNMEASSRDYDDLLREAVLLESAGVHINIVGINMINIDSPSDNHAAYSTFIRVLEDIVSDNESFMYYRNMTELKTNIAVIKKKLIDSVSVKCSGKMTFVCG